MTRDRLDNTCRQRAMRRLASMHRDEFADLLAAERLRAGLPPEAARPESECGTRNGYESHRRAHEPACQPCKDAAAAYRRDWIRGGTR